MDLRLRDVYNEHDVSIKTGELILVNNVLFKITAVNAMDQTLTIKPMGSDHCRQYVKRLNESAMHSKELPGETDTTPTIDAGPQPDPNADVEDEFMPKKKAPRNAKVHREPKPQPKRSAKRKTNWDKKMDE